MVNVFREVWRVMRDDGTMWVNIGDCYATNIKGSGGATSKQSTNAGSFYRTASTTPKLDHGLKNKDIVGIPWRLAFALQDDGWYLRSDIIWHKPNPMPESVTDRPTKAHEYIFLLVKQEHYFYDADAIAEPCEKGWCGSSFTDERDLTVKPKLGLGPRNESPNRNKRSVWTVPTRGYSGAHFATFPPALIEPCILAGCRPGDIVLDPFSGSGTTGVVCVKHQRRYVGLELNPAYIELSRQRVNGTQITMVDL